MLSVADAIDDPDFLGPFYSGKSWDCWRAIWREAQGEAHLMTPRQRDLFAQVAQREPPDAPVRELVVIGGRRGGKDATAAAAIACAASSDYSAYVRPGEAPCIMCLAVDRDQAKIVLRYTRALFDSVPMLRELKANETREGIELTNGNEIVVQTNNFRSVRGRTVPFAVFDEAGYWRDEASASPDKETYRATLPSMSTIPTAMLAIMSSPYRRQGLLYDKFAKSFGQPDPRVLVVLAPSLVLNPMLDPHLIEEAMNDDPAAARAEYYCEWRDDVSNLIDRAAVEQCVDDYIQLPPSRGHVAFLDCAGGSGKDAMAIGIAHSERGAAVLDCIRWRDPPFSPKQVVAEFSELLKSYRINRALADGWGNGWTAEAFREHAVTLEQRAKPKSEIYVEMVSAINSAAIRLPNVPKLINQICSLERRVRPGGRDIVDAPRSAPEDVANAALGALSACTRRKAMIISDALVQRTAMLGLGERAAAQLNRPASGRWPPCFSTRR